MNRKQFLKTAAAIGVGGICGTQLTKANIPERDIAIPMDLNIATPTNPFSPPHKEEKIRDFVKAIKNSLEKEIEKWNIRPNGEYVNFFHKEKEIVCNKYCVRIENEHCFFNSSEKLFLEPILNELSHEIIEEYKRKQEILNKNRQQRIIELLS